MFEPLFDLQAFKLCTDSTFPTLIFWGPEYKCFYNEGFAELMKIEGGLFFGKEGSSLFCKEAWSMIHPLLEDVIHSQTSIGSEGQLIYCDRKGFLEECYFDYNLEPMMSGEIVQGVYCTLIESTKRIHDQRRLDLLTQLSNETLKSHSIAQACETITNILNQFRADVPFTLTYLLRSKDHKDQLCSLGVDEDLKELFNSQEVSDEIKYIDGLKHPVSKAVLIPIKAAGQIHPFCLIIFGISPTLELNDDYREFHILLSRFLSTILSKIHVIEMKQKDLIARDEFISIASHEFKTPITALKLRLALTNRKINVEAGQCPSIQEMQDCITTSDQQADRLNSLVDELLDMTRIQRGKFQFIFEEFNLCEAVKEVCFRFQDQVERAGNSLLLSLPGVINVRWHKSRIDQVLTNLFTNALKYAPGSVIRIEAQLVFNTVRLIFADTGPGIPSDKLSKIFDRFVGGNTSERVGGLGLGLYIVKEIVHGHRGIVEVTSEVGEGSIFTILVPTEP